MQYRNVRNVQYNVLHKFSLAALVRMASYISNIPNTTKQSMDGGEVLRKGIETVFSKVVAISTTAQPSKGQMKIRHVHQTIVLRRPAGTTFGCIRFETLNVRDENIHVQWNVTEIVNPSNDFVACTKGDDRQDGTKYFFRHDFRRRRRIPNQRWTDVAGIDVAILGASDENLGSGRVFDFFDHLNEPCRSRRIDDTREFSLFGVFAVLLLDRLDHGRTQGVGVRLMDEDDVGRDARLTGVGKFSKHDAIGDVSNVRRFDRLVDNGGAFPAEFQNGRRQCLGARLRHEGADAAGSGKDDFGPSFFQQGFRFGDATEYDLDDAGVKVLFHQFLHECAGIRTQLAGFDNGRIPRGEDADEWS
mmetsp:Transcript_129290/g.192566  ORF Transcript_129290/g.192566 Transcript_129290/m.192566 type:complete len:359 (+) Transcript_129290:345-1421(+)